MPIYTSPEDAYKASCKRFPLPSEGDFDHEDPLWQDDYYICRREAILDSKTLFVGTSEDPDFEDLKEYTRAYGPDTFRVSGDTVMVSPESLERWAERAEAEEVEGLPGSLGQFGAIIIGSSCPPSIAKALEDEAPSSLVLIRVRRGFYPADPRDPEDPEKGGYFFFGF